MENTTEVKTVVVADVHSIVREGIRDRLEMRGNLSVIAEAQDGYGTLKACRDLAPDILLMDFSILRPSGREVLLKMAKTCPDTRIIVLSSEVDAANAFFSLANGAVAFIPKQASGFDFVNATTAAIRGFTYMPTSFISSFLEARKNVMRSGNIYGLSPREIEIVDTCIDGKSTKEVAELFGISVRTVETHKNNIYKKTSCRCMDDLVAIFEASEPSESQFA